MLKETLPGGKGPLFPPFSLDPPQGRVNTSLSKEQKPRGGLGAQDYTISRGEGESRTLQTHGQDHSLELKSLLT